jgi:hypothetical protein
MANVKSKNIRRPAQDDVERTTTFSTTNPEPLGLSKADEHCRPFTGTVDGGSARAGRKPGQVERP